MARNRNAKKPRQPIPAIPELGNLHKPRKGNRRAARLIAEGDYLWDHSHRDRKARRLAISRDEARARRRMEGSASRVFVEQILAGAPGWKMLSNPWRTILTPKDDSNVQLDELIGAATGLELRNPDGASLLFTVAGLTFREHIRLRAVLPEGITSVFTYHPRTATRENAKDLSLAHIDPRDPNY